VNIAVFVMLLFAAVFFLWVDMLLFAVACVVIALYFLLSGNSGGLGAEIAKDLEEAEGQVPGIGVLETGLKEMGAKAGAQAFSDDERSTNLKRITTTKFKLKPEKAGEATGKVMELFKKLFE